MTNEERQALIATRQYLEALDKVDVEVDGVDPSFLSRGIRALNGLLEGPGCTVWVARVLWLEDRRDSIIALFSTIEKAQAWVAEMIVMNPPKDCGRCGYAAHTVFEVHLDSGKCL